MKGDLQIRRMGRVLVMTGLLGCSAHSWGDGNAASASASPTNSPKIVSVAPPWVPCGPSRNMVTIDRDDGIEVQLVDNEGLVKFRKVISKKPMMGLRTFCSQSGYLAVAEGTEADQTVRVFDSDGTTTSVIPTVALREVEVLDSMKILAVHGSPLFSEGKVRPRIVLYDMATEKQTVKQPDLPVDSSKTYRILDSSDRVVLIARLRGEGTATGTYLSTFEHDGGADDKKIIAEGDWEVECATNFTGGVVGAVYSGRLRERRVFLFDGKSHELRIEKLASFVDMPWVELIATKDGLFLWCNSKACFLPYDTLKPKWEVDLKTGMARLSTAGAVDSVGGMAALVCQAPPGGTAEVIMVSLSNGEQRQRFKLTNMSDCRAVKFLRDGRGLIISDNARTARVELPASG
jgi:hypothetical protein